MMLGYLILAVLAAAGIFLLRNRVAGTVLGWLFYAGQAVFALGLLTSGNGMPLVYGDDVGVLQMMFFTLDPTGALFFALMALIAPVVYYNGLWYLDEETPKQKRMYNALLVLLNASIACVYFSNNVAVTWIFLEATTLCTAGLIYHRRNQRSLEATWKYIFVCSVGIAIAYLGILLMGGMAVNNSLEYTTLGGALAAGSPLFLKIAFLFILTGYSCKMEVFPLYTIGVDANFAAPAPASAFISTALVNAGFVALFRIYKVMSQTAVFPWVSNVLIVAGLLSVFIGAVFMRRTNHYKRFLSYSTVENMGIVLLGLGIGGPGVFAAVLHIMGHTLIKSTMFMQVSQVGKTYGHYQVNRIGGYSRVSPTGSTLLLVTAIALLAFPPSVLFVSEVMIFRQMMFAGKWWLLALTVLLLCFVIYNFGRNILRLCYGPSRSEADPSKLNRRLTLPLLLIVAVALGIGLWQPQWFVGWINAIITM